MFCSQNNIEFEFRETQRFNFEIFDLCFCIGWRWMVQNVPSHKLIIFHDSLLPKYRGFAPLVNALLNREEKVGVSAILGAKEYDKGNILIQCEMEVTYPTYINIEISRISLLYANLALDLIKKISKSEFDMKGNPQEEIKASYSLWLDDEDYRINWSENAENILHFINCVGHPYKGASSILKGELIRIFKGSILSDLSIVNRTPGKVIFIEKGFPVIVCGKGLLLVTDVRNNIGDSILPLKNFRSRFS